LMTGRKSAIQKILRGRRAVERRDEKDTPKKEERTGLTGKGIDGKCPTRPSKHEFDEQEI